MNRTVSFGDRLREERNRLGMTQTAFGEKAGVTKKSQVLYEAGERIPDVQYLSELHEIGVDVVFVVAGVRSSEQPAADAAELALLDCYRRCVPAARVNLLQTAALLAARVDPTDDSAGSNKIRAGANSQNSIGDHAIQIGSANGKVNIKRGK